MKLKTAIAALALALPLPALATGIPVIDGLAQGTRVINHVEDIAKYVEQIAELKAQYDALVAQYNAITGSRNLGDILNNPALREYMPEDWQGGFDSLKDGYNGLSGQAKSIYDKYKVFDSCGSASGAAGKAQCYSRALKGAQDKANWTKAYDSAKSRIGQIESLMQKINTTKDAKAIAELQGRIQAEQALLQNQQAMLDLAARISAAEDRMMEQQRREKSALRFSTGKSGIKYETLTF
ncbi:MAG: P-type DNA transfer protein VirB5 [Azoarcus sp.]|jgi:type IV secretion system protein VirB5|nr:P-type DNA transfer protein VirB5 [Azoarcus sp.]